MEEKASPPANESGDGTSGPASTASAERDEKKEDALVPVILSSPGVHDGNAETDVKAVDAAPSEEPAKRKGKTALTMVAICVSDL